MYDDRGLLYIRMGDPDEVSIHGGSDCIEPNVSWAYDRPGGYRVFHLSPGGGADDWYLLENLAMVYRCGTWDRNPMMAISPLLLDVPGPAFYDLYMSRMGLDPRYARIANHALNLMGDDFAGSRLAEELTEERDWTWQDGEYAVASIPERPPVDLGVDFALEWLQFRAPRPGLTRVWLNGLVEASALRPAERDQQDVYRVDAVWTLLDEEELLYRHIPSSFDLPVVEELDDETGISLRKSTDLAPGTYRWMLVVSDANSSADEDGQKVRGGLCEWRGDRPGPANGSADFVRCGGIRRFSWGVVPRCRHPSQSVSSPYYRERRSGLHLLRGLQPSLRGDGTRRGWCSSRKGGGQSFDLSLSGYGPKRREHRDPRTPAG